MLSDSLIRDESSLTMVSRIMKMIFFILPVATLIISGINVYLGNLFLAAIISILIPICGLAFLLLRKGWLNASIVLILAVVTGLATFICTIGHGIHEIGMIVFPVIVLFSSFVLRIQGVIITTTIVLVCLAWLVYGQQEGYFPLRPAPPGSYANVIIVSILLIINLIISYSLVSIIKMSLRNAVVEINDQKQLENEIRSNLEVKILLLQEVHHRVKNNLSLVNSILDLEVVGVRSASAGFQKFKQQVQTIAKVHEPILDSTKQEIDLKDYLETLIFQYVIKNEIKDEFLDLNLGHCLIDSSKAVPFGVTLNEAMSLFVRPESVTSITLLEQKETVELEIKGQLSNGDGDQEIQLIRLMAVKLGAKLEITDSMIKLIKPI